MDSQDSSKGEINEKRIKNAPGLNTVKNYFFKLKRNFQKF